MMKPFRKNVAVAIDGGGIKGVIATRALSILEDHLGKPCSEIFSLAAGTSTGSIISAAIAAKMNALRIDNLYRLLGEKVFKRRWRYYLWLLAKYRYSNLPLILALKDFLGEMTMEDLWSSEKKIDLVITVGDLWENRTRFVKPWKKEYRTWKVWSTVLASCTVPTYFPIVIGRYIDGGVGSYGNPCYLAAYEAALYLDWDPAETTLLSLGTGRERNEFNKHNKANRLFPWEWLEPILDTFLSDASDQQVRLVQQFFKDMDFRRFQIDIEQHIPLDDPSKMNLLIEYGNKLGQMILEGQTDKYAMQTDRKAVKQN